MLQALATPSRLLILGRLRQGRATVGELSEAVGMEQSAVSHQLRLLRNLGLVEGERQGRSINYALYDNHVAELLDQAIFHTEHLRLGATDRPRAIHASPDRGTIERIAAGYAHGVQEAGPGTPVTPAVR